uniref:Major facilitator superfamily (MFS) profile domain-containing protein n=1 Tax=Kalanchoe fedtschenkoi TaxID=63787 RepID=A0A7N1A056_KALFE
MMLLSSSEVVAARGEAVEIESAERRGGDGNVRKKKGLLGLNGYALAAAVLASTNSILLGYDIGVMSGALLFIEPQMHLSNFQKEMLVGSLNFASLIGSLASGKTSDWIGRRYTIVLAAGTFLLGAVLMGFAQSYAWLMAGRVVAGIGVGYALMIAPLYVAELSPAMTRGFLTSLPEVFITVGVLVGYLMNLAFARLPAWINWRIMLGIAGVPAIGIALGVIIMPESPRWLVMKGRTAEARRVLVRTSDSEAEAEIRLLEITNAAEAEALKGKQAGVWKQLLLSPTRPVRRMVVAAVGINFFMQASGNDAVIYYSPQVFKEAGLGDPKERIMVTVVMGIAKTSFCLVSAMFLDNYGRRPLLMLGTSGMAASSATLGLTTRILRNSTRKPAWAMVVSIIAVCADVSFFSLGLGPITWVYSSEIFPLRLRAQGTALAVSVNRAVSGTVSTTFLTISEAITFSGMFFIFAGIMAAATLFVYFFLPETKGISLEDICSLFERESDPKDGISSNAATVASSY